MANYPVDRLKANPRNPRKIVPKKESMLEKSLARFGDLSSVVFCRRNNMLIGGHQRVAAFTRHGAQTVTIERTYDAPTPCGTVAEGYFTINGEKYGYREVEFDELTASAANLAANKGAGEWHFPLLIDHLSELDQHNFDLDLTMFDGAEVEKLMGGPTGELEDKPFTMEEQFKILIECRDDAHQTELLERFNAEGIVCKAMVA
jgi:hypothetical protein